jgi:type VI secretion system (T6SS) effector TldE1-like protein
MMRPVVLQGVGPGEWMAYVTSKADKVPSGRGISLSGTIALVIAAFAWASGVAAWIADFDPVTWVSDPASPKDISMSSFDDRFSVGSAPDLFSTVIPRSPVRSLPSELEIKFQQAKGQLAQQLQSQDRRVEPTPSSVAAVPLPRSRPVEANLELKNGVASAQTENRTLLQKLSDLLPARVTLASLAPDGGLFREGPDLASLGYDNVTAVYDISARAVYMPDGSKLEAHSGFGSLIDDPAHVSERNVGATPPNVYDLKPREQLFHGVQALRMIPAGDNGTLGRSGLLAHSYMLGPKGDSNGCVSIKNYEKFLKAFSNGEIKRLVVVPSLSDEKSASRRSTSQS